MSNTDLVLKAIGVFESEQVEPYQAGRQPDERGLNGKIKLNPGQNFEQATEDLIGCSHIWIIFGFHHNNNWKPLVQTPRSNKKIGVFATRAPYRPNPIGLSLVKLIDIKELTIDVGENDILNGSPIYDIKPYHPEHDIAPEAQIEWLRNATHTKNDIHFSPLAEEQLDFLEKENTQLKSFIQRQLEYDPLNSDKKRVAKNDLHGHTLSYRTWRIDFTHAENTIGILAIRSGYTETELDEKSESYEDKYNDKQSHRKFNKEFN
ncbi:MAG: tRNA (N6-threonylcarbamoyladenosine(37)-N6)-methyltransferase TrmO [Pseudobdellovibrio sp.]